MGAINGIEDIDKIKAGDLIQVGTFDKNKTVWKPPYEEGVVNTEYWNDLNNAQRDITHYHRRIFEDESNPST